MTKYLVSIAPKVKGGIVMVGEPAIVPVDFCPPPAKRQTDSAWKARFTPRDPNDTTVAAAVAAVAAAGAPRAAAAAAVAAVVVVVVVAARLLRRPGI